MVNLDTPSIMLHNMFAHTPNMNDYKPKYLNPDPKSILILGNGFDLDLGMKTSYRDFAKSEFWPFKNKIYYEDGTLSGFLNEKKDLERWFDIEEALAEYAKSQDIHRYIEEDKKAFNMLVSGLHKYLQNEQDTLCMASTVPASYAILENIVKKEEYVIYSFNYTDLHHLAKEMMIEIDPKRINYVHGSLRTNDIIIGTGDTEDLPDEYSWLYKSFSPNYRSNNLVEDLSDADEIYIFGHSFGKNDFDYFEDFFQSAIHERTKRFCPEGYEKIKVRIFTKDADSEINIKQQLRKLTQKHVIGLYAHCDFIIYHTEGNVNWFTEEKL